MKKTLLTTVCSLIAAGASFAQGTISWSTLTPTFITAQTNSTVYSSFTGGGSAVGGAQGSTATTALSFYYTLMFNTNSGSQLSAPSTTAGLVGWQTAGLVANNNTGTAGRLTAVSGNTAAVVPWANGTSGSIMLVGWSVNLGTDLATVLNKINNWSANYTANAFFGTSSTGFINPNPGNPGATIFGSSANASGTPINSPNMQLNLLSPVPEPSTMVLAGLGGLAMLGLRRKK